MKEYDVGCARSTYERERCVKYHWKSEETDDLIVLGVDERIILI
jgi:hypothetical protein